MPITVGSLTILTHDEFDAEVARVRARCRAVVKAAPGDADVARHVRDARAAVTSTKALRKRGRTLDAEHRLRSAADHALFAERTAAGLHIITGQPIS